MAAASRAAATSGALALPPGPLGMLTVLPDLVAVWHIQRQLVSDIAAVYGRTAELRGETMFYCLFRHAAAQVVRDVAIRIGERILLRRSSVAMMSRSFQRVGLVVSQRALTRGVSRWLPIAGAVGVGAYAFYDTLQVGRTAQELFESEIVLEPGADVRAGADVRTSETQRHSDISLLNSRESAGRNAGVGGVHEGGGGETEGVEGDGGFRSPASQ